MNTETAVLWSALGAFGVGFLNDAFPFLTNPGRRDRAATILYLTGTALLLAALITLVTYFLTVHLQTEYVFTYTRRDYPWYYRMAGLWAGQKGTLLMWAAFTACFGGLFLRKSHGALRRGEVPASAEAVIRTVRLLLFVILGLLTYTTILAETFAATPEYLLQFRPDGNGLQAVLITPFMIIHPPIQFFAYGLMGVLFAAGAAYAATGNRAWADLIRPWTRLTFLFATIGLGLGGLWAYYVLNFGGFWAWDPVETANLLAWFPVTLLLHAFLRYREGGFSTAAPFFALLTLPMALFATVATRTGLWVSVHAFTDPSKNFARDPLVRFLNILDTNSTLQYLAALLAITILLGLFAVVWGRAAQLSARGAATTRALATAAFFFVALFLFLDAEAAYSILFQTAYAVSFGRNAPLGLLVLLLAAGAAILLTTPEPTRPTPDPQRTGDWTRWITAKNLLTLGVTLLGLAFLVILLLDLVQVNGYERVLYDDRMPLVALPAILTLSTLFLLPLYGARKATYLSMAAGALGALGAVSARDHWQVLLVVPGLLLAAYASLHRFLNVAGPGRDLPRRDLAASTVLVLGAFLGFLYWGNPPTHLETLGTSLRPQWSWSIPAYAACTVALLAGALHRAKTHPTLARAGALLLLPVVGPFGLSTLAGIGALFLLARATGQTSPRKAFHERRPALRKATIYLLHAALALGLTGYAFATYESDESDVLAVSPTSAAVFQGYAFRILDSRPVGLDEQQRLPKEVHADVEIRKDGQRLETTTLIYWLVPDNTPGHYDARVTVVRTNFQDLYLYPLAFHTDHGSLTDHINFVGAVEPPVTGVDMTVKVLPGMNLVWSGLWLLGLAMAANLALGGLAVGTGRSTSIEGAPADPIIQGRPDPSATPQPAPVEAQSKPE